MTTGAEDHVKHYFWPCNVCICGSKSNGPSPNMTLCTADSFDSNNITTAVKESLFFPTGI